VTSDRDRQVRLGSASDAGQMARLLHDFNVEFDAPTPGVEVLALRLELLLLTGEETFAILAGAPAVAVALVTLRPNVWYAGRVALLEELYVAPSFRGRGIGSKVIQLAAPSPGLLPPRGGPPGHEGLTEAGERSVSAIEINVDEGRCRRAPVLRAARVRRDRPAIGRACAVLLPRVGDLMTSNGPAVRYAAFLRGINVGGRRVDAQHLCAPFEASGFQEVASFLASGNVCFTTARTAPEDLEAEVAAALQTALGFEVDVFVRTAAEITDIAGYQPFPAEVVAATGGKLQVNFLRDQPTRSASRRRSRRPPTRTG
jgi:GNAT superfamily N-acetyltransferase